MIVKLLIYEHMDSNYWRDTPKIKLKKVKPIHLSREKKWSLQKRGVLWVWFTEDSNKILDFSQMSYFWILLILYSVENVKG